MIPYRFSDIIWSEGNFMNVYHGSDHIIEVPLYNGSKRTNDYGYGFYTTESIELAKEWACSDNRDGFANCYEASLDGLSVLNLNSPEYSILNWLAILARYRTYWQNGNVAEEAKNYLQRHFFIDPSPYDVIIGYRADDSYFTFAQDFVSGAIPFSKFLEAMRLGKLGEQIVFKSREAFSHIRFTGAELADAATWHVKKVTRDRKARRAYRRTKQATSMVNELFMIDIMREYGAVNSACLDGGTSTQMYYNGEIVNNPYSPTGPRRCPTAWLVGGGN